MCMEHIYCIVEDVSSECFLMQSGTELECFLIQLSYSWFVLLGQVTQPLLYIEMVFWVTLVGTRSSKIWCIYPNAINYDI